MQHNFTGIEAVSEWLNLHEREHVQAQDEDHNPESLALTPNDWIACNGEEDETWVVEAADWLNNGSSVSQPMACDVVRRAVTPPSTETSSSDFSSDMYSPEDEMIVARGSPGMVSAVRLEPPAGTNQSQGAAPMPTGTVRSRTDEGEPDFQFPERKRPRLEPC
jgi:hypothetical protein